MLPVTKPYFYGWKTSNWRQGTSPWDCLRPFGELRREITEHPENIIGSVVECACMEVTEDSLRHPILE